VTNQIESRSALRVLFDVSEHIDLACEGLSESFVQYWCSASLQGQSELDLGDVSDIEISVQLVDSSTIQALNLKYRGKNTPTNVLSFNSDMPMLPGGFVALGDLVLCPDVVQREAREQEKALNDHWAHLLVHGTLHLCGYDHEELNQAETMESMEIRILSESGISDPYLV
jgi:probable rRNA maturation factor